MRQAGTKLKSGIIFEGEGLYHLADNEPGDAMEAFSQARRFYKNPEDILRVVVNQVAVLRSLGKTREATAMLQLAPEVRTEAVDGKEVDGGRWKVDGESGQRERSGSIISLHYLLDN